MTDKDRERTITKLFKAGRYMDAWIATTYLRSAMRRKEWYSKIKERMS
jgi:hypothetical protein